MTIAARSPLRDRAPDAEDRRASAKVPTIGFCMGELGVYTRILAGKFGAPFTYATFNKDRELAPGQLSFDEMRNVYRYDEIGPRTEIYGVVGDPIGHSLSPLIHNAAYRVMGMDKVYVPFRVPKDALNHTLDQFTWLGVKGYSVTLPHKEAILSRVTQFDGPAMEIGAANTLYCDEDGSWWAANSDYDAALESLQLGMQAAIQARNSSESSGLSGKRALMLGAGGVARAIGLGLVRAGARLTIANRTHDRAAALAAHLECQQTHWENRASVHPEILVNCTPVGMHPDVDESPFADHWLQEGMVVFDTIYNPEQTLLDQGCQTAELPGGHRSGNRSSARPQCNLKDSRDMPLRWKSCGARCAAGFRRSADGSASLRPAPADYVFWSRASGLQKLDLRARQVQSKWLSA